MIPKISIASGLSAAISTACLIKKPEEASSLKLTEREQAQLEKKMDKEDFCTIHRYPELFFLAKIDETKAHYQKKETARVAGNKLYETLKASGNKSVQLVNFCEEDLLPAFIEGLLLSSYQFDKYKKEKEPCLLEDVIIVDDKLSEEQVQQIANTTKAVFTARDLVNEPLSYLTATQFSSEIERLSNDAGFTLEVFNKKKIETLKMGGLLAVNKGSIDPPTFNIL
ncbi:MAG TPA: hypothetical protein VEP89_08235, partial [Draconibacterium sp.]|nr:hypothetical protein [Draconibacterium sp.]